MVKLLGKCRRLVLIGLVLVLALLLAALAWPQRVLCVESGPVEADVIVVLGGGGGDRAKRAAELFLAGAAPRILVSGDGDTESNRRLLIRQGVPAAAIQVEPNSMNTQQNATFSAPLLRRAGRDVVHSVPDIASGTGARRVIVVTSWYHSRRALQCFRHYVPGIQFYSRPSYYGYRRSDWTREGIGRTIRVEYLKLVG
ncbi:MAG TPA: YdcF family protein, partial [Candidatus Sulfotelmatobacter sp.]|nr:YdcF family protein [Candidatus Sulfotelmatobacter sp.]